MEKIVIEGGKTLRGKIRVGGAKNAALPIMVATLLSPGKYKLTRVPNLRDTRTLKKLLEIIGVEVEFADNTVHLNTVNASRPEAPYELVKTMRASFYVLGPLLARFGRCKVSLPGGCAWGPRPVDLHLKGMKALGATIELDGGYIIATADKLKGSVITLDVSSVGATGNIVMAAVLAEGDTVIENAAREPEIVSLCHFLNKMGARIGGIGTDRLEITGVSSLSPVDYEIIPDRIEAGTFIIAGALCGDNLTVEGVDPAHLTTILSKVTEAGAKLKVEKNRIIVSRAGEIKSVDVTTAIYPGFPTDMQAQWIALMLTAKGTSVVKDTIYIDRFTHVPELIRLGADISLDKNVAVVKGVEHLIGAPVMSTDIRASASLILAGLIARGRTDVHRVYHIDRGYEKIEEKLSSVGASVWREKTDLI